MNSVPWSGGDSLRSGPQEPGRWERRREGGVEAGRGEGWRGDPSRATVGPSPSSGECPTPSAGDAQDPGVQFIP